jgi:hypothetical protein
MKMEKKSNAKMFLEVKSDPFSYTPGSFLKEEKAFPE